MADKLSEGGKSVLLVEKGPKSLGRFDPNGTFYKKPGWLEGSNLSRFDVPGLANQIYTDAARIVCNDTELRAGCLLGGGATINAGLWWKVRRIRGHKKLLSHLMLKYHSQIQPTGTRISPMAGKAKILWQPLNASSNAFPAPLSHPQMGCSTAENGTTPSPRSSLPEDGRKSRPTKSPTKRTTPWGIVSSCTSTGNAAV